MLELGGESDAQHLETGRRVAELGIDVLVTAGKRARNIALGAVQKGMDSISCHAAVDASEAAAMCLAQLREGDSVLIKGSRGMRMETAVAAISKRFA